MTQLATQPPQTGTRKPRLGFVGLGWIGLHRMQALLEADAAEAVVFTDPSDDAAAKAAEYAPDAARVTDFAALLDHDLDGVVIATPSAMHARQASVALERGMAVFCQKPLARTEAETRAIIDAARRADRLLCVDFSYRLTDAFRRAVDTVRAGELGDVYAVDLTFHNAYGPDKPWFRDPNLSGGGCVIDLGVHLVDLTLWALGWPAIDTADAQLFARGERLGPEPARVEDFATATLTTATGTVIRLTCSWNLHAGQDAAISAAFYGPHAGVAVRNVGGSFYDFAAHRFHGTATETLAEPPDAWGGRAAVVWARRLADNPAFDPEAERLIDVAAAIDRIYGRGLSGGRARP